MAGSSGATGQDRRAAQASQGRVVFVASAGLDIGSTLAAGLAAGGAKVVWFTDSGAPPITPLPSSVKRIETGFCSRAALERAFATASEHVGPADQIVHSAMPAASLQAEDIASMSDEHWSAACRAAMSATLYCLQASFTQMSQRGGSVVLIGPSLSLAGAAGLVPLSTAIEGQRGLAKSSARQWGRLGLSVNWIAAAPRSLSPLFDELPLPVKPDAVPIALGRPLDLLSEIVPMIEFLGSNAGRVMTGATLVLDGGEWMVP